MADLNMSGKLPAKKLARNMVTDCARSIKIPILVLRNRTGGCMLKMDYEIRLNGMM